MKLCEKFGWTLHDIDSQPWEEMDLFLDMMQIEQQFNEKDQRLTEKKYAKRSL